ncbi:MAG: uroporphyrinogen decarboxylase family protein [Promethearchaeota archaeon]
MSSYERCIAAIEHKQVDRFPTFSLGSDYAFYNTFMNEIGFTPEEVNQYATDGVLTGPPWAHGINLKLGFDADWASISPQAHYDPESKLLLDTFGGSDKVVVNDDGIPHLWYLKPFLTTKEKIKDWWNIGRPKPYTDAMIKPMVQTAQTLIEKYEILSMIGLPGPYENLHMSIGMAQVAKFCRKDQQFLEEILEKNFEVQGKGLERMMKLGNPPVVMCGDDWGYNHGLQMPVKYWRQFIKPILKRYIEIVRSYDSKFLIHSCGNIGEIFSDLVELGIDGVESLQPAINDLPALKQKYGDKIALLGTIDDTNLLVNGTTEHVWSQVTNSVKVLGKGSGYIPGATNTLLDAKVSNVKTMIEAIQSINPEYVI